MAVPPKYAFITLEPGLSKRDVFLALSQYGDVRLMSKISEVSTIVTDLVRTLEEETGEAKTVYVSTPPVVAQPSHRPVRITQKCLPTDPRHIAGGILLGKRPNTNHLMPEPLPRPPPSHCSQPSLKLPTFSSSSSSSLAPPSSFNDDDSLSPMQQLQQSLFSKEEEMVANIKTEDDDDDFLVGGQQFASLEEAEDAMGMSYHEDEPSSSFHLDDEPSAEDLQEFMDEEGNIEVPYAPNFEECKTSRTRNPVEKSEQARCEVCRRWVRTTNTLSRLISHVSTHAQKERYVCPGAGCEFSAKTDQNARKHIRNCHGGGMDPIDMDKDKKARAQQWKAGRNMWAPRCFPDHFEKAPGGNLFMRVNEKTVLMN